MTFPAMLKPAPCPSHFLSFDCRYSDRGNVGSSERHQLDALCTVLNQRPGCGAPVAQPEILYAPSKPSKRRSGRSTSLHSTLSVYQKQSPFTQAQERFRASGICAPAQHSATLSPQFPTFDLRRGSACSQRMELASQMPIMGSVSIQFHADFPVPTDNSVPNHRHTAENSPLPSDVVTS